MFSKLEFLHSCIHQVIIYYDIPLKDLNCRKFEPDLSLLEVKLEEIEEETAEKLKQLNKNAKKPLVSYLLYNVNS